MGHSAHVMALRVIAVLLRTLSAHAAISFVCANSVAQAQSALASVTGVAFDSLAARPIPDALIQLVPLATPSQARTTSSDLSGEFRFDSVANGDYLVGLLPSGSTQSLFLYSPTTLRLREGQQSRLVVGVPSIGTLRRSLCANAQESSSSVIAVRVLNARTGTPVYRSRVQTRWREVALLNGNVGSRAVSRAVDTNFDGIGVLCDVAAGTELQVSVTGGDRTSQFVLAAGDVGGLWNRTVYVDTEISGITDLRNGSADLIGTVNDQAARPIRDARVALVGGAIEARTDSLGHFRLTDAAFGTLQLSIRALGFEPASHLLDRVAWSTNTARIVLDRITALRAVRVGSALGYSGFADRQRAGRGLFIDEMAIRKRDPMFIGDLLGGQPGVAVTQNSGIGRRILVRATRGFCAPTIYIDGISRGIRSADLDAFVASKDVRAIEVYRREEDVPPQFNAPPGCGALIIWRRLAPSR